MAAVLPRRTAAADRASISSAHERSKLCLRQEFMKLPSFAVWLWAALWGTSDHKLRPEKFLWMYFRTGVQLSSSPPHRNGLCSIPIFLFCKKISHMRRHSSFLRVCLIDTNISIVRLSQKEKTAWFQAVFIFPYTFLSKAFALYNKRAQCFLLRS